MLAKNTGFNIQHYFNIEPFWSTKAIEKLETLSLSNNYLQRG